MSNVDQLLNTVVRGGYCIGCGACGVVKDSPMKIRLDPEGRFQAYADPADLSSTADVLSVCPFSQDSVNEDTIGRELYGKHCGHHDKIGYSLNTYVGHVSENGFRDQGSSGGLGTWILVELLRKNMIDAVIHIHQRNPTDQDGRLFTFGISRSEHEIRFGAKSRYYPVEMSEVLNIVREQPLRFAVVGVPCFIKAIRLLIRKDPQLAQRIKYCIGLVCGHLKSTAFAEMFAWESGIVPNDLTKIDFRKKMPERPANDYGVALEGAIDGKPVEMVKACKEFKGYDWGKGFFKYSACDYCDDVLAETADLVIGDAWLPEYVRDGRGTNVVITRVPELDELIKHGIRDGQLELKFLAPDGVAKSQDAGLRHRREGLAYRLFLKDRKHQWRPVKRVEASDQHLDRRQKKIFGLRMELAEASHSAFRDAKNRGDYSYFQKAMLPLIKRYEAVYARTWHQRLKDKIKRLLGK